MRNKELYVKIKDNNLLIYLTNEQHQSLVKHHITAYSILDDVDLTESVITLKDYQINRFLKLWHEL